MKPIVMYIAMFLFGYICGIVSLACARSGRPASTGVTHENENHLR